MSQAGGWRTLMTASQHLQQDRMGKLQIHYPQRLCPSLWITRWTTPAGHSQPDLRAAAQKLGITDAVLLHDVSAPGGTISLTAPTSMTTAEVCSWLLLTLIKGVLPVQRNTLRVDARNRSIFAAVRICASRLSPSGSAGCAPRPVPGRGHAASIPDASGRRWAPRPARCACLFRACLCGGACLLFPSSLHTVLAVKVCAHGVRWRPFGRLRTCDRCAAACRFRSRAIPP